MRILIVWFIAVSAISLITTIYDKWASRHSKRNRVPEKMLFLLALIGGSVAMYLTMLAIRHKTKHKRFMIGLPAVVLLQYGLLLYFVKLW